MVPMAKAKGRSPNAAVVITANRLGDGRAVWLGAGAVWREKLGEARIFRGDEADQGLTEAQESEKRQEIVGAYEVDIAESQDGFAPVRQKEQIRARGPSIL